VKALLEGGKVASYGAKAIPEAGYFAMPKLSADGLLICGDSGGFLNGARLKGTHLAIKSGMLAAETLFECLLAGDFSKERLAGYEKRVDASWAADELRSVRNFHQGFEHGLFAGMFNVGVGMVTGGRDWLLRDRVPNHAGHERMEKLAARHPAGKLEPEKRDGALTFDKLADVYLSGTAARRGPAGAPGGADTSVCATRCRASTAIPASTSARPASTRWCPTSRSRARSSSINASNCVHCKTCDIADPYQIITWVTPKAAAARLQEPLAGFGARHRAQRAHTIFCTATLPGVSSRTK
jgi:electron-transferring-flavoprotein dehydrogenase